MKYWSITDKKRVTDWLDSRAGQQFQHQQWWQEEEDSLSAAPVQFRFVKAIASKIDSHAALESLVLFEYKDM